MSAKKYTRITYTERLIIEKMYNSNDSMSAIARRLKRSVSSISYEIHRGLYEHLDGPTWKKIQRYSADIAQDDADFQASAKGQMIKLGKRYDYANEVSARIRSGESPDSIVGDLRSQNKWTVSTPTLYRYISQGFIPDITNDNLIMKSRRKRAYRHVRKASRAPKGESIEKRPETVSERIQAGHWEMDTVIGKSKGKNESLLVLTERTTRFEIIRKLPDKTALSVTSALADIVCGYPPGTFRTVTVDNGSENQDYDGMKKLVPEIYYCHPYSSYERGSNENANNLIRRFFPKGQSMSKRTQADADKAAAFMNHMHRKILGYRTSQEMFDEWQQEIYHKKG